MSSMPSQARSSTLTSPLSLTKAQQELQARNKELDPAPELDSPWEETNTDNCAWVSHENVKSRRDAAITLDNLELVRMLAMSRNDSVAGTRYHLEKIRCGFITQYDLDAEAEKQREERIKGKEPALKD